MYQTASMLQWFENWFDSPFYHRLYFDRDEREASVFIRNLLVFLQPQPQRLMLDVACGKGRHAVELAAKGNRVTGIDISANSIAAARLLENADLEFYRHDMRLPFRINYYHYAFNLFTSFGYFRTQREHDAALRTIAQSLQKGGFFVFDYLNSHYVAEHLVPAEEKTIEGTHYAIKRNYDGARFMKEITVSDAGLSEPLRYTETVAAFTLTDFEATFARQQLTIKHRLGDYSLNGFNPEKSKRLILIAEK